MPWRFCSTATTTTPRLGASALRSACRVSTSASGRRSAIRGRYRRRAGLAAAAGAAGRPAAAEGRASRSAPGIDAPCSRDPTLPELPLCRMVDPSLTADHGRVRAGLRALVPSRARHLRAQQRAGPLAPSTCRAPAEATARRRDGPGRARQRHGRASLRAPWLHACAAGAAAGERIERRHQLRRPERAAARSWRRSTSWSACCRYRRDRGILDADLLRRLPEGARLVNVARGRHLVEAGSAGGAEPGGSRTRRSTCSGASRCRTRPSFWRHPRVARDAALGQLQPARERCRVVAENSAPRCRAAAAAPRRRPGGAAIEAQAEDPDDRQGRHGGPAEGRGRQDDAASSSSRRRWPRRAAGWRSSTSTRRASLTGWMRRARASGPAWPELRFSMIGGWRLVVELDRLRREARHHPRRHPAACRDRRQGGDPRADLSWSRASRARSTLGQPRRRSSSPSKEGRRCLLCSTACPRAAAASRRPRAALPGRGGPA